MIDKLASIEGQYEKLLASLGTQQVQSDANEYRKQAKALAEIEPLRKEKKIGSSLQAKAVITASGDELALLERYKAELPMLCIVSDVDVKSGSGAMSVAIERAAAVGQPAHDHAIGCDHLLTVDPQILARLVGSARHDQTPGDEGGCVARPAGLHRKAAEVDL